MTAEAAYSKRRKEDVQPIRTDLAKRLRPWLKGKSTDTPVFDLPHKTAKMLQFDLEAANIPYRDEAGRVADLHSLRHTYITRVVESGATVKVAQELARHSDPTLTIGHYAHTRLHDLTQALDNLPGDNRSHCEDEAAEVRATGTDDTSATPLQHVQKQRQQYEREIVQPGAIQCETDSDQKGTDNRSNLLRSAELRERMRRDAARRKNTPGRIRTSNPRIRSPMLYPIELRAQMPFFAGSYDHMRFWGDNALTPVLAKWLLACPHRNLTQGLPIWLSIPSSSMPNHQNRMPKSLSLRTR